MPTINLEPDELETVQGALQGERARCEHMQEGWKETSNTYKRYQVEIDGIDAVLAALARPPVQAWQQNWSQDRILEYVERRLARYSGEQRNTLRYEISEAMIIMWADAEANRSRLSPAAEPVQGWTPVEDDLLQRGLALMIQANGLEEYADCRVCRLSPALSSLPVPLATAAEEPVAQPDWSQAPEWAMWWAVDRVGGAFWYEHKPTILNKEGWTNQGRRALARMAGEGWADSLRERPQVDTAPRGQEAQP